MDSDRQGKKQEGESQRENGDPLPIFRNLLSTSRVRYNNKDVARLWDSLLEYNVYFLPAISLFFWIIYLFFRN